MKNMKNMNKMKSIVKKMKNMDNMRKMKRTEGIGRIHFLGGSLRVGDGWGHFSQAGGIKSRANKVG